MNIKIKVLISGQHTLIRESLHATLDEDNEHIVTITCDYEHLSENTRAFQPDIVLLPVDQFSEETIKNICMLKSEFDHLKVLLFMTEYDDRFVIRGLDVDVDGFTMDDDKMSSKRLQRYIYELYEDDAILSGKIAKVAMQKAKTINQRELLKNNLLKHNIKVSPRELEVLYLLMQGKTNMEMGNFLNLKEKSVRDYVSNAYRKLGINKRKEIIAYLKEITGTSDNDSDS